MMSLRIAATKLSPILASPAITTTASRALSTQTSTAVEKLRNVVEDYRQANYSQELPTRMKKDIVRAASAGSVTNQKTAVVNPSSLQRVLRNIGVGEHILSPAEIQSIFDELGNNGVIEAPRFIKLI